MDVASDQEPVPLSKPVHAVFTIEQVRPHFDALMAEELPAQEDLCCNLMTHKYRGSIVVLSISKSVEPNEEQKEMTSGFQQGIICKC